MTNVLGVDACKSGWVAVEIDDAGFVAAHLGRTIDDVHATTSHVAVIAIDIPIGLLNVGTREADVAARSRATNASTVFSTPPRSLLTAPTYTEARALAAELGGKSLSSQAYWLGPKILEVDAWLAKEPRRAFEVHPEVSFVELAGRKLRRGKKTWAGARERSELLRSAGIVVPDDLGEAGDAGVDDILDAAVAAWTARRIARDKAVRYPPESSDGTAIWA